MMTELIEMIPYCSINNVANGVAMIRLVIFNDEINVDSFLNLLTFGE